MSRSNDNLINVAPDDMRIFVALGQARSLTQAAASLQLPLSTVSRALKRIETAAQLVLIKRGGEALHLTGVGREYYKACRAVLEAHETATEVLTSHRIQPEGTLRIGVPILFGRFVLAEILPEFHGRFPQLRIEIDLYCSDWDQTPKVVHDVFLKLRTPDDSRHHLKLFPAIRRGMFASPRYLAARSEPSHPSDIDSHSCLGYDHDGRIFPWSLSRRRDHLVLYPKFRITAGDPEVLARLAINEEGLAILPLWLAHPHVNAGRLVPILPEWIPDPLVFCALHSGRSRMASKEVAFLNFLESVLGTARDPRSLGGDPARFFVDSF